jgi:hypothetical protein
MQIRREHLLEVAARFGVAHRGETGAAPRFLITFDDKRAGRLVKLVRVGGKNAGVVFTKR